MNETWTLGTDGAEGVVRRQARAFRNAREYLVKKLARAADAPSAESPSFYQTF